MANLLYACAGVCGTHDTAGTDATFTLRLTAVMLETETEQNR